MGAPIVNKLLWRPTERAAPLMRLFCFSHAGMGASAYRLWPAALPVEIEMVAIQLPGRESRLRDAPYTSIASIVTALESTLPEQLAIPFAFFGHSMGAVVAFETARALERSGRPVPTHLFVSGRRPPRIPDPEPPMHTLPTAEFIAELQRRYGGIPAEVLEHADLMELLLPCVRADITALETHEFTPGPKLQIPISAFGGTHDVRTPRAHLEAWREETSAKFRLREFPGEHFYLTSQREALLADIVATTAPITGRSGATVGVSAA
jgi:medium-chain acyl-[acyl-carrier-protein] hydrolase